MKTYFVNIIPTLIVFNLEIGQDFLTINNLCIRISFFSYFKNNEQLKLLKEIERNYCLKLYQTTNDNEIKLLLDNKF